MIVFGRREKRRNERLNVASIRGPKGYTAESFLKYPSKRCTQQQSSRQVRVELFMHSSVPLLGIEVPGDCKPREMWPFAGLPHNLLLGLQQLWIADDPAKQREGVLLKPGCLPNDHDEVVFDGLLTDELR
jgi:hypothetical protein